MHTYATVLAAAIGVLLFSTGQKSDSSIVTDTRTNVSYHGISHHGVDSFLNIPFGQDTSGSGRFAPPKPYIPAQNTAFNATVPGPDCPQQPVPFPGINGIVSNVTNISEDCLNLRITRPSSISRSSRLPVMVYIYGGGYYVGQIYDEIYHPNQLVIDSVKSGTPVIYVAMNYRLGTLFQTGRFSHVPMMIGWNNDDGSLFPPPTIETEENMVAFLHFFSQAVFDGNPAANLSSEWTRASRILRDIEFTCPSVLFATHTTSRPRSTHEHRFHSVPASKQAFWRAALAKIFPSHAGHYLHSLKSPPVFLYHLNKTVVAGVLSSDGFPGLGISHLADIPYIFDEVARFNATPADTVLAKQISGSWSRFATSGHPSSSRGTTIKDWQAAWAPETVSLLKKARVMVIGGPYSGMSRLEGVKDSLADQRLAERCGFILSEKVLREIGL